MLSCLRGSYLLPGLSYQLSCLILDCGRLEPLGFYHGAVFGQRLLGNALRQEHGLLPDCDKGLRDLRRQRWQACFATQALSQAFPHWSSKAPTRAGLPRPSSWRTRSTVGRSPRSSTASAAANTSVSGTPTAIASSSLY